MLIPAVQTNPRYQAYVRLWLSYCADGAAYGRTPTGVARWAYLQALPHVCPATADLIARAVLDAGHAVERDRAGLRECDPTLAHLASFRAP